MSITRKIFIKAYPQGKTVLFPESMDTCISVDFPVRLINSIVDQLDTSSVMDTYKSCG